MNEMSEYFEVLDQRRAIVDRPIPKETKQAECMSLFRDLLDHMASARKHERNPPLRLYADMLVLRELLRSECMSGELGEAATGPAHIFVRDWLSDHATG